MSGQSSGEDDRSLLARYGRQMALPQVGPDGQRRLRACRVAVVGCGALGSALANTLVRAGVGYLRLIDRDFLELDNLQRQTLFDEQDVAADLPKAEAAARKLRRVNSQVTIEPVVADLHSENALELCSDVELLLDGTDNLETRYLLNDVAVSSGRPWVYGACLGTEGLVLPIVPRRTACLRCVWEEPPPPGSLPTCETAGILATTVQVVAAFQATAALQILLGRERELCCDLLAIDVWSGTVRRVNTQSAFAARLCPCCGRGRYEYLEGSRGSSSAILCGRTAVQILPSATAAPLPLADLAARMPPEWQPHGNEFLLRFVVQGLRVTVFPDGRAIIQGTSDLATARAVYARCVGM